MPLPGFQDALNRKYDIQQQDANARSSLENAQANAIPSSTASENALRSAQAFETTEQGKQVAPLAGSQVREAGARGGLYGAQSNLTNTEAGVAGLGLRPTGLPGALQYTDQVQNNGSTFDQPTGADVAGQIHDYHTSGGLGPHFGRLGDPAFNASDILSQQPLKKGSANVHKMPPGKAPAAMAGKGGGIASLVASLGGGGSQPMQGAPTAPPSPMPGGAPPQGSPGPLGFFGGTPQVPGQGSGNVDKVPAMLAPHEAVLTHGAADQLGRGKIAKLNAQNPPVPTPGRGAPPPMTKKPMLRKGMV